MDLLAMLLKLQDVIDPEDYDPAMEILDEIYDKAYEHGYRVGISHARYGLED